jgi:hypothetical protein
MGKAKKLAAPRPDTTAPGYSAKLHQARAEPLVVVVVPTRELAMQIFDEARRMCYRSMLRPCVVYGGLPMPITRDQLGAGCDVLIATPGRLCDLMDKPHILTMSRVKYILLSVLRAQLDTDILKVHRHRRGRRDVGRRLVRGAREDHGRWWYVLLKHLRYPASADIFQIPTMMPTTST